MNELIAAKRNSRLLLVRVCSADLVLVLSVAWMAAIILVALAQPLITPLSYDAIDFAARLMPPFQSLRHPLGTDDLGRDILSRLFYGVRVSMLIAIVGVVFGAVVGIVLGMLAARFGRLIDEAIVLLMDLQAALPFLVLALALVALFGPSLWLMFLIVGLHGWDRFARLTRNLARSAAEQPYAVASRILGGNSWRVYMLHVLPNISSTLLSTATIAFPDIMLVEAALSFLGLGVQPPAVSLGSMLGFGRDYLMSAWWIATVPGVTIFLTALSAAKIGDVLRDHLDPYTKRQAVQE